MRPEQRDIEPREFLALAGGILAAMFLTINMLALAPTTKHKVEQPLSPVSTPSTKNLLKR